MKLNIFDIEEFIKVNKIQEVTNPIGLTATKMPSPDGIFSYEIFGYSTEDRKNTFAYIDLRDYYFHPQIYKTLQSMGSLGKIAIGEKYAIVVDRKVKVITDEQRKDFPDAETGVEFFYNNFEKINWNASSFIYGDKTETDDELSIDKKTRIKLFRYLSKKEIFVHYWLVLPPYYRDFVIDGGISLGDDVNKLYKELILKTMMTKKGNTSDFGFSNSGYLTKRRIQDILVMLYNIAIGPITGKTVDIKTGDTVGNPKRSILKRNLIGRYIDFAAYSVISAPETSSTETVDEFSKFGEVRVALQSVISMFKPFFINYCYDYLEKCVEEAETILRGSAKKFDRTQFSVDEVDKHLTRFIKSASEKYDEILIEYIDKENNKKNIPIMISEKENGEVYSRSMKYIDLFYIAAVEITKDKYALVTRYPVTNHQNIYIARVVPLSTARTRKTTIMLGDSFQNLKNIEYNEYPYVKDVTKIYKDGTKEKIPNKSESFYDLHRTCVIGNGVISSLGADYDGDMLFFKGLYTKEANAEAEKLIWKKTNWFGPNGQLMRGLSTIGKDVTLSLYELTKD